MSAATDLLVLDDEDVREMLAGVDLATVDPGEAWRETALYMQARTSAMFRHIRSVVTGGTYRGVTWAPMKPQYTRFNPGTGSYEVVPAWGGLPRIREGWSKASKWGPGRRRGVAFGKRMNRVTGKVSGRLRPSNTRVTQGSSLMQDTGNMRARSCLVIRRTKDFLQLGPQGVRYAAYQNRLRRFLFFELPQDAKKIGRIFAEHIARGAKQGNLGRLRGGLRVGGD